MDNYHTASSAELDAASEALRAEVLDVLRIVEAGTVCQNTRSIIGEQDNARAQRGMRGSRTRAQSMAAHPAGKGRKPVSLVKRVNMVKDPVKINDAARRSVCAQALLDMGPRAELAGADLVYRYGYSKELVRRSGVLAVLAGTVPLVRIPPRW